MADETYIRESILESECQDRLRIPTERYAELHRAAERRPGTRPDFVRESSRTSNPVRSSRPVQELRPKSTDRRKELRDREPRPSPARTLRNADDSRSRTSAVKETYLNTEQGILSWLLTTDHKRIGILYTISITFFFFLGGFFALLMRLELIAPT